jgi:hypothetical protein
MAGPNLAMAGPNLAAEQGVAPFPEGHGGKAGWPFVGVVEESEGLADQRNSAGSASAAFGVRVMTTGLTRQIVGIGPSGVRPPVVAGGPSAIREKGTNA